MHKKLFYLLTFLSFLFFIQCKQKEILIVPLSKSWEKAIPMQQIPEGLTSLSAKSCSVCHMQHYQEWKLSTHAHAWTDMQFQSELKKESSPFMCINCHIPLHNQQEFIVKGLINGDIYQPVKETNPHFDKELQLEGITCASCHVRNNAIIGPTGTTKAPHRTVKDTILLSEQLCISCHNASAVITPTLACSFETGDEWKSGPYFGKKNCISCHMDSVHRELVTGYGKKLSHLHYFAGSGIPKIDSVKSIIKNGLAIYPSLIKNTYKSNDTLQFHLKLKNELAGHKVPTGDPERFFNITFTLLNELGEIKKAETHRIGEQWEWYPEAKKLSDNNMAPLEERNYTFSYLLDRKEKLIFRTVVTKHRMDAKTAEYNKLGPNYPLYITIYEKEYALDIN